MFILMTIENNNVEEVTLDNYRYVQKQTNVALLWSSIQTHVHGF